jgi:hypothetical protein
LTKTAGKASAATRTVATREAAAAQRVASSGQIERQGRELPYRERGPVRQQRQKRSKGEKIRRIMPAIHVGCRPEEHPLRAKVSLHIERLSGVSAENLRPGNPDLGEVSA